MRGQGWRAWAGAVSLLVAGGGPGLRAQAPPEWKRTSCVLCHLQLEESELRDPVRGFEADVHARVGLSCDACHGGNPSPSLADDVEAMSEAYGYRGAPDRLAVPQFCGRCHADPEYIRRYNPRLRTDQLAQYRTSRHGQRNAAGDAEVAVCTDCHGVHGILPANAPESPTHPRNVPNTCGRCHADRAKMRPYGLAGDEYEAYLASSHADALLIGDDLSAPACNDCHGNHGAAPPGVEDIVNVCGSCHVKQEQLLRDSFKNGIFQDLGIPGCISCHTAHRVVHPGPVTFRTGSEPKTSVGEIVSSEPLVVRLGRLEPGAHAEVSWYLVLRPLADRNPEASAHRIHIEQAGAEPLELEAEVPMFDAGYVAVPRVVAGEGLRATLVVEPLLGPPLRPGDGLQFALRIENLAAAASGELTVRDLPQRNYLAVTGSVCMGCHEPGDRCDEATNQMFAAVTRLDRTIREVERLAGRAERAGMDVSQVMFRLKTSAVAGSVEAHALVHSFDPQRILAKADETRGVAEELRRAAEALLREIEYRRRGLAVSLVLILLVLLGLYLKIRDLDRRRRIERLAARRGGAASS